MIRIQPLNPDQADTQTRVLLDKVQQQLGVVPNLFKTMAHSPAVLASYLEQTSHLAGGAIDPKLREQIAMASAGKNQCDYCASAHRLLGKQAGLEEQELIHNLAGQSDNLKTQTVLTFVQRILTTQGRVSAADIGAVRDAGFSTAQIVEIIAHTCLNIFTNYFNHIAGTEIDFPLVETAQSTAIA